MGTQFFLKGNSIPELNATNIWQNANVNCQTFNQRMVKISFVRGVYYINIGAEKIPFKTEEQMNTSKNLIYKHQLGNRCVVTLGNDKFEYWY